MVHDDRAHERHSARAKGKARTQRLKQDRALVAHVPPVDTSAADDAYAYNTETEQ